MPRRRIKTMALAAFAALLAPAPAFADEPAPLSVLVFDIRALRTDDEVVRVLTNVLLDELGKRDGIEAFGAREVEETLIAEARLQMAGGGSEDAMAEIAAALGVDYFLAGSLSRLGEQFLVTLRLVDRVEMTAVGRVAQKVSSAEDFLAEIDHVLTRLFATARMRTRAEPPPPEPRGPALRVAAWTLSGLTAAALVAGAVGGGLALESKAAFDAATDSADRDFHRDEGATRTAVANVGFISAGVLGAAALTCFVIDLLLDPNSQREPDAAVGVGKEAGGWYLVVTGTF